MKIFITLSTLCILPSSAYGFGTQAPALMVRATITCTDGTVEELSDVRINGSTDVIVYTKPEKVKSIAKSEIILEINPRENSVGPLQLSTMKKVLLKNPHVSFIYQDPTKAGKDIFKEIEIDGTPRLIPNNWKLHGTDKESHPRNINLDIIEKIIVTETYTKAESTCKPCEPSAITQSK